MYFKNKYKKMSLLLLACSLICLPACKKKHKKEQPVSKKSAGEKSKVNFPLAYAYQNDGREDEVENVDGLFDNEVNTAMSTESSKNVVAHNKANTDFDWSNETVQNEYNFKTIYFDFDKHAVREDQKEVAVYDAIQLKELLTEAREAGQEPLISIEGHACHSAGNDEYNLIKSQNRAHAVLNIFKELGVPTENIKVVGRGKEFPAVVEGKKVTGSREEQWANRRVEVHIISA